MKMKHGIFVLTVMISVYSLALALPPGVVSNPAKPSAVMTADNHTMIDVNNLQMFVTNQGGYAEDWELLLETAKNDGLYYPAGTDKSVLFSAGIWVGGSVNDQIRLAVGAFDTPEYFQGPADDNGNMQPDQPRYKVYKIRKDSTAWTEEIKLGIKTAAGVPYIRVDSQYHYNDWVEWQDPAVVADGAPLDDEGNPLLLGDQTLWTVFNDGGEHEYNAYGGGTDSLGVELQATFFGFNLGGALGNTIFAKWIIINKSPNTIDSTYVSLWADPDLGNASDDFVGCDTILSLGYCYNAGDNDNIYAPNPPAVGFDFLQGPIIKEGDPLYAAVDFTDSMVILNTGDTILNAFMLPMTSFNKYINGTDPDVPEQGYGYMRGFNAVADCPTCPYVDPNGVETKFFGAGDPVADTGWLDSNPADRRYMLSTGPFTFYPNDTQIIVAAIIVGQGTNAINSVQELKTNDILAQLAYDLNFLLPTPPPPPIVKPSALDRQITLTWGDDSEVDEPEPYDLKFEGYVVYQGATKVGPWQKIAHLDIANGIDSIYVEFFNTTVNAVDYFLAMGGTDQGLQRYITINRDFVRGGPLHNGKEYYYAVTSYNYTESIVAPPEFRVNENPKRAIIVVPQDPSPGTHPVVGVEEGTIQLEHTGPADAIAYASIIDPVAITGDTYNVVFTDDPAGTTWDVVNVSGDTDVVVVEGWSNQSGDEDYPTFDGIFLKVVGPPPGVKTGDMFANPDNPELWGWDIPEGTRRFTWAQADGFGWEGFRGAIGWGGPGDINGFGGADPVPPADLPDVLLVLAQTDSSGNFDAVNDTNVSYAYRYIRNKCDPPARPEFAGLYTQEPTDPDGGCSASYNFEDFEKSCPLSAWNVSVDPPERLAVGYLENNAPLATLDGIYFPAASDSLGEWGTDNIDAAGPREWLWIFLDAYSETPNPAYQLNSIDDPMPIMYWLTVARRTDPVPFSEDSTGQDQFLIIPTKVNSSADTFSLATDTLAPFMTANESDLDRVRVVPNPYYAYSAYEADQFDRQIRFLGVPEDFTIRIFNIAGDMVRKLESDDLRVKQPGQSWAQWNLATDQGLPVASGIYIWLIDAPGFGTRYGKMAVFPEVEQLTTY
jgi:hypothetical protein